LKRGRCELSKCLSALLALQAKPKRRSRRRDFSRSRTAAERLEQLDRSLIRLALYTVLHLVITLTISRLPRTVSARLGDALVVAVKEERPAPLESMAEGGVAASAL